MKGCNKLVKCFKIANPYPKIKVLRFLFRAMQAYFEVFWIGLVEKSVATR